MDEDARAALYRLTTRGENATILHPVAIELEDVATDTERGGSLISAILPLVIGIWMVSGAMPAALDTTAGEKERKSLEPLLINPVQRWQIMTGKMITTMVFAMASLALTLVSFRIVLPYMPVGAFE